VTFGKKYKKQLLLNHEHTKHGLPRFFFVFFGSSLFSMEYDAHQNIKPQAPSSKLQRSSKEAPNLQAPNQGLSDVVAIKGSA